MRECFSMLPCVKKMSHLLVSQYFPYLCPQPKKRGKKRKKLSISSHLLAEVISNYGVAGQYTM
uniref:Uncharacterized protein n=1 Tax=Rhizophora mucronata TaxID=61149 RepID=A0A2P2Q8L5_RHIMU